MDRLEFEAKLVWVYVGKVKALIRYVNKCAVLLFLCDKCGAELYGKPSYMVVKNSQRHIYSMPYSDFYGTRLASVSGKNKKKYDKGHIKETILQLDQLLDQGVQSKSVARRVGLNHNLVFAYVMGNKKNVRH